MDSISVIKVDESANSHSKQVRAGVAAFNRRDFESIPRVFSEDLEFRESPEWPQAGFYRGREAFAGYVARLVESVNDLKGEVLSTTEEGNRVLTEVLARGKDRSSSDPVELSFFAIYEFNDRSCVKLQIFLDRDRALAVWRGEREL